MAYWKRILVVCLCWQLADSGHSSEDSIIDHQFDLDGEEELGSFRLMVGRPQLYSSVYQPTGSSPYQVVPGSYKSVGYGIPYKNAIPYDMAGIYKKYLSSGTYQYSMANCSSYYGTVPRLTETDITQAFLYANNAIRNYPQYTNDTGGSKAIEGLLMELASEYFARYKCFDKYQLSTYLPRVPVDKHYLNGAFDFSCLSSFNNIENYKCYPYHMSKYRTIDGSCNNIRFPYWGRSSTCHIRLLPADYSDGIQAFRMSYNGKPLPNPRMISNYVAINRDFKAYYTSLLLGWGQFINHDISNTEAYLSRGKINCCKKMDNRCSKIPMTRGNDFLTVNFNTTCMNFMRSIPCPHCKLGPREQLNTHSSFLDGSQIYGVTGKETSALRSYKKGMLLASTDRYGNQILPPDPDARVCTPARKDLKCFKAGDDRANQQPLLLALHTLLLRNHNYHAYKLGLLYPSWNDETLFQEARRITIAEIQHITYNEYLPVIMGPLLMKYYKLKPLTSGYTRYEPYTDPSTWNEFVTAASRYGHSQIADFYSLRSENYANRTVFPLADNFFEPGFAWDGRSEDLIRGSIGEAANTIDPYYSHTTKNLMAKPKPDPHGIDLVAVNIQRGRDHGIPGYINYLKACFNYNVKDWYDLERFIPVDILAKLKNLYSSVEDIDLYIGGVSERHFPDSNLGPTFGCLVGIQFYHLKYGDRYFYEHGGQSGSLTTAQLDNIRKTASMARLLCRCSRPTLTGVQPRPFYLPSSGYKNEQQNCQSYPEINYLLWNGY